MLALKSLLSGLGQKQAQLARAIDLSPSAISQLINHNQWPRSIAKTELKTRISGYLSGHGAQSDAIACAFNEVEPARRNALTPASPEIQPATEECDTMLMPKQVLLPATKKTFALFRDPFDDLQSAEDMYVSPDIRYIREALYQAARHDGFLAVIGESGAGKSTLRRDLINRLITESAPVIIIEPYVLAMEDNDTKGKTLKCTHLAEAIMASVAPLERLKASPEARFAQLHHSLKASHAAGYRHTLIIEEAHSLPIPTLKQLKRLRELEAGFTKLLNIILIGQPELHTKLSPRNGDVREVVQRIEVVELQPISTTQLEEHLAFRFQRAGKALADIMDNDALQAVIDKLSSPGRHTTSQLYPLALGNLMVAALNLAAKIGESRITADVVKGA